MTSDLEQDHPDGLAVEAGHGHRAVARGGGGAVRSQARGGGQADHCGLLRVTRVPFQAPSSRRTSQPSACAGQPDHPVGHVVHAHADGDGPLCGGHRDPIAVGDAGLRRGGRRHQGHRRPGRSGQERLAVLHPAGVEQLVPGGQERLAGTGQDPRDGREGRRRASGYPASRPARPARGGPRRHRAGRDGCPSHRRSGPAPAGPTPRRPPPGRPRTTRACPPSSRTCPAFSGTAATGSTTSARSVTALGRSSRLTTKGVASSRAERELAVRQVGRVHAGHDQGVQVTGRRRGKDLAGVPAGLGGQRGDPPGPRHLGPRLRVGHRAPAGQQHRQRAGVDRAPLAGPPGHPGQRRAGRGGQPGQRGERARASRRAARPPG